uniref:C-type lectin domain-containing protein n=1 Tax=Macrostomum lignano TaxID=282301 RepID=A0A1I8GX88_9PLAT
IATRYNNSSELVPSNTNCKFVIRGWTHSRYLITVVDADLEKDAAYLEVTDSNGTLLHDVNLHFSRRLAVSRSGSISVNFSMGWHSRRTGSGGGGYRIRLERLFSHQCPPNWTQAVWTENQSFCISPSSADFLGLGANATAVADYITAQYICNRLRANLLMPPKSRRKSKLGDLQTWLYYKDLVWIGLMSNSSAAPGDNLYWLDKSHEQPQKDPDFLTCRSGYTWSSGSACQLGELFGLLRPTPSAYLLLERPNEQHYFACSAPLGGTDDFYPMWLEQSLFNVQAAFRLIKIFELDNIQQMKHNSP